MPSKGVGVQVPPRTQPNEINMVSDLHVWDVGVQLPRPTRTITPHALYLHFCELQVYVVLPW